MAEVRSGSQQTSDGELLRRTRAGDNDAFGELYERRCGLVLAFLMKRTRSRELALDLTAETFASALLALGQRPPQISDSAAPWLLTIARNRLVDSHRHGRVESAVQRRLALEPAQGAESDVERVLRLDGERELLSDLARELSQDQYEALHARVLEGRDYEEIARELDCSPAVVRKRVSRAIATLRQARLSALAVVAIAVLLLAAAAFAATQLIGVGAPVRAAGEQRGRTPSTGIGVPVGGARSAHGTARLLNIAVPDPGGGLPWGMRIVRTTRGLVCVQIGRLLDGRLGVVGADGAFDDDGRFHELPVGVLDSFTCGEPRDFTVYDAAALPANGAMPGPHPSCLYPGTIRVDGLDGPSCPDRDERDVLFGVLGPHAVSVSYRMRGQLHAVPVTSAYGAYLLVLTQPPLSTPRNGSLSTSSLPLDRFPFEYQRSPLAAIDFRFGGRLCQTGDEPQRGGSPPCTAAFTRALPSGAAHAVEPAARAIQPAPRTLVSRLTPVSVKARKVPRGYELTLTFAAPIAVHSAATAYAVEQMPPQTKACGELGTSGLPIERDVARGQRIRVSVFVEQRRGCHGIVRGRVIYGRQPDPLSGPAPGNTVGRFAFALP
jgi:RNA polymerase sigma factor (sigma-70 family)